MTGSTPAPKTVAAGRSRLAKGKKKSVRFLDETTRGEALDVVLLKRRLEEQENLVNYYRKEIVVLRYKMALMQSKLDRYEGEESSSSEDEYEYEDFDQDDNREEDELQPPPRAWPVKAQAPGVGAQQDAGVIRREHLGSESDDDSDLDSASGSGSETPEAPPSLTKSHSFVFD